MNILIELGKLFNQRDETIHLSVDLLDRLFLKRNSNRIDKQDTHPFLNLNLNIGVCFLIASKYDELDENIPQIKHLARYFQKMFPNSSNLFNYINFVECERYIMKELNWQLFFVLPIHFVKLLHANGVLFEDEQIVNFQIVLEEIEKNIDQKLWHSLKYMHLLRKKKPSVIGAGIIYCIKEDALLASVKENIIES